MEATLMLGAVMEGGALPPAPKTCRNGHVRTSKNTWQAKNGDLRCRDCRRAHKPLKTRACKGCKQPFAGSRGKYCIACASVRHMEELEHSHKPIRTRTCADCDEVKLLAHFERHTYAKDRRGVQQYSDRCDECRAERPDEDDDEDAFPADSPYEIAKRQVERIFGLPAREWINSRGHVLSDLHYLRTLAIQHAEARRTGGKLTRPETPTGFRPLWKRIVASRLTARTRVLSFFLFIPAAL